MRKIFLPIALLFAAISWTVAPAEGVTLTGDTSKPEISTFAHGEKVELTFDVDGLKSSGEAVKLEISVADEHDKKLETREIPVQADANGRWQTKIAAPSQRLGFYRVYAKLSNGVPLQALGSRAAGFLTYAVVPDPATRLDYGEKGSRFGMQGGFGPWADNVLALLGARWVLDGGLEWKKQEPDGTGQFGPEQAAQYVKENGAKPGSWHQYTLPTLFSAPAWATVPATAAYMTGTLTPSGEKAWSAYCKAAARAYAAKNPDRKEHIYQITWEPIPPWGFKGTDADLIRIYELAYKAIHAVDPRAVVSGPTRGIYNNGDPQATVRLFHLGLGRYLDGYTAHPYEAIAPEEAGMVSAIRTVKDILHASTKKDLPLMGTEQGWTTNEDPAKDLLQAQGLLRQNLIMLGEGFRFNFAFYIVDYHLSGQKGYGYYYNLDKEVPFGPQKVSPHVIAAAYAAQSLLLDGCRSVGAVDWLGEKVWGYVFERPGSRILAVWNYGPTPRSVSIPTGVKQVQVFDWMGNERLVKTTAGNITLPLGPEPVYIRGVAPGLWGDKAAKTLRVGQKQLQGYPNGRVSITGSALSPAGKAFRGTLLLETDKTWGTPPTSRQIVLGANRRASFRFDLPIPAAVGTGTYPARLILRDAGGNTVCAAGVTLEVVSPLSMRVEPRFRADGRPEAAVTLQDKQGQGIAGRLDFRLKELLPGARRPDLPMIDLAEDAGRTSVVSGTSLHIPFRVASGGSRRLILTLPAALSPTRRYQDSVTISTPDGRQVTQTASIDFLPAWHLRRPVAIDGDLAEWASLPAVTLTGPQDVIRSPQFYPKESGLSAQLRYAWDEQALYLAAEVQDNVFFQKYTDIDVWRGDCLQLAFNLDPKIPDSAPNAGDRRTSELTVALTKNGPEAYRQLSFAPTKLALGPLSPQQIHLAIRRIGAGNLIYEMAIPWTSLGRTGGPAWTNGDVIGVAATVNELRSADQNDPCALGLFGGIAAGKDPDKFGTLVLTGKEQQP